ncbi:hypothetical protein ABH978_000013 [Bradyrhizobium ottawaense]
MSDDTFGVNGWTVYAHPLFLDQFETMIAAVEKGAQEGSEGIQEEARREAPVGCLEGGVRRHSE